MDDRRFDDLTRSLARGTSRRGLLRGLAAIVAGGLAGARLADDATAQRATRQANGAPCSRATDCASMKCVDGVCCNAACTGQCESCASGTCLPVVGAPVGTRPDCPGSDPCRATCDGVTGKTCAAWPGAGVVCGATTSADGWLTTSTCGGNGSCVPTTTNCAPYGCTADGASCASGCASHDQCPGSSHCANGVCVGDKPLGASCADGAECQHGICANGVCCAEACNGPCRACGPDGFCGPAADDSPCAGGLCCEGSCIDTSNDVEHCGACHRFCLGAICQGAVCTGGVCGATPHPDSTPCDDGLACIGPDTCRAGACVGASTECPPPIACRDAGICDPATGDCIYAVATDGTDCDDGNACTDGDACQSGVCAGTPKACDDGLACTENVCTTDGFCVHPVAVGWCRIAGACVATGARNPANPCQRCDPVGSPIDWSNAPQGAPCDDTTLCNGREACNGRGECVAGIPVSCQSPGECQEAGVCDPATGQCTYDLKAAGAPCRTMTSCTTAAACDGEHADCPPSEILVCADDGLTCTDSCCDPDLGCVHEPRPGFCLLSGVCFAAGELHANGCGVCDPSVTATAFTLVADGTPCPDRTLCEQDSTCRGGSCVVGTTTVCPQPTALCQDAVCDPEQGTCELVLVGDGALVRDQKGCDVCPGCLNGVCQRPLEQLECGLCQTCDRNLGACVQSPAGADCGSTCTERWTCSAHGTCVGPVPSDGCFNFEQCSALVCNPETALCEETGAKDGQACGDDVCHVCDGGRCVTKSCGPCERCDPEVGCVECSPCCDGICDQTACGNRCCGPDRECCGGTADLCVPKDKACEGHCLSVPRTCCGRRSNGSVKTCDLGWTCCQEFSGVECCPPGHECCFVIGGCCPPGTFCGPFGCSPG